MQSCWSLRFGTITHVMVPNGPKQCSLSPFAFGLAGNLHRVHQVQRKCSTWLRQTLPKRINGQKNELKMTVHPGAIFAGQPKAVAVGKLMRMTGTRAAWTSERRARQAEVIRRTKPWRCSTGPRSAAGKAVSATNATAFRRDPQARAAYLAIKALLKNPFSPMAPALWKVAEAGRPECTCDHIAADMCTPSGDDRIGDFMFE